jgi:hypothetical protein
MVAKLESVIRNTLVLQPARTLVQNFIKFKTCVYSGVCNYLASEKKCRRPVCIQEYATILLVWRHILVIERLGVTKKKGHDYA